MAFKRVSYKIILFLALCWIVFVIAFSLGAYVHAAKIWPYSIMKEIHNFISGDIEEESTLAEKIINDVNIKPSRHIVKMNRQNTSSGEYDLSFSPNFYRVSQTASGSTSRNYHDLTGLPLNSRREMPKIYFNQNAPKGFRLLLGAFDFEDYVHGVILLDHLGTVKNIWKISQENVDWHHEPDTNVFPHGFEIAPDGSIIIAWDGGTSLTKYNYEGDIIWRIKGSFHHSIAFDGQGNIWTWGKSEAELPGGNNLIQINYETGKILREFPLSDIMDANPDIDIFGILQEDNRHGSKWITTGGGQWHENDIDPLMEKYASNYPDFIAGDLLISLRSPDLVFVANPDSLKVKWWRQGLTRRQHDPDWNNRGTITIFNNNMHRGYSNIVEINPSTYDHKTIIDGKKYDFYTRVRGKHQLLPNGGVLITSTQQGRVFEVDHNGEVTFEFLNYYGNEDEFAVVSESRFLPTDFFTEELQ